MADNNTFFFLNNIDNLRDPVRSTRWRVLIPQSVFQASGFEVSVGDDFGKKGQDGTDEFALHVKTCDFPELNITDAKHNYMGFESSFPVNVKMAADLNFTTILLEDMRAYEAMLAWSQACINTAVLSANDDGSVANKMTNLGLGLGQRKDTVGSNPTVIRNSDVKVELYNWMYGDKIVVLRLINAYPLKVAGPKGFNYDPAAKLQNFNFTLRCDRWSVFVPSDKKV